MKCRVKRRMKCRVMRLVRRSSRHCLLCGLLSLAVSIGAQEAPAAMAEYESLVMENNRDLAALQEELQDMEKTYTKVLQLSDSSLSVDGGYAYTPAVVDSIHTVSGSASVSVPVLPQISLEAQADTTGIASLSLIFTPLAGLAGDAATELQLAMLKLEIAYRRLQLRWQSRIGLLQYAAAKKGMVDSEHFIDGKRREYEYAERQFKAGFYSSAELRNAADEFAAASVANIGAIQEKAEFEKNLYMLGGLTNIPESVLKTEINAERLHELIAEAHEKFLDISSAGELMSQSHQAMHVQKHYLEKQLKRTWAIEPGISLSLSGSVSDAFNEVAGSAGASAGLQLSSDSFHFGDIKNLRNQIADLDRDLVIDQTGMVIDKQNMEMALEVMSLTADIAMRNLAAMNDAEVQAGRDLKQNTISEYEYQDIKHSRNVSEINYVNTLIAVYGQIGTLLQSYGAIEYMEYTP